MKKALIVIPARMASTRYPNKPMCLIAGKTMIERVWEIASTVTEADAIIATDDAKLFAFINSFGGKVIMTASSHLTGTDRVAEVARLKPQYEVYFSFQGDAVLTPPWVISDVLHAMNLGVSMATPAVRTNTFTGGTNVVFDLQKNALYFSRAPIPNARKAGEGIIYRHIGLYAYRKEVLQRLAALPESPLEKIEKLEQLRALENGIPIRVVEVDYKGRSHGSVDHPEDVAKVEAIIAKEGELLCALS